MRVNEKHKSRTGAEALVESLRLAGVEVVFGYPGGNVIDIFESVRNSELKFVLARHEQGSVHMADGYARASGRPGVVMVTSGPGLTNTITGLGAANIDGVPMVLICGQVPLSRIGTDAFQEADTTGLTRSVSKHNVLLHSADEIPAAVAEAFYVATHGKPGPVVIDLPLDVQQMATAARFPEEVSLRSYRPATSPRPGDIRRLVKMLSEAERPLLYAGGGVISSGASDELLQLAKRCSMPVVTSMMGIGAIDERLDFALGMSGRHGSPAANRILEEADLVLALGARFNDRVTDERGRFAPGAKLIHIDCDASSIRKNVPARLGVVGDVKLSLTQILRQVPPVKRNSWMRHAAAVKRTDAELSAKKTSGAVDPREASAIVGSVAGEDAIIVTDVGQHQLFAAKCFPHVNPRHFITSGGMGAMGFGIPAAIGAAVARPEKKVVAIIGDGGAQMTWSELIVAAMMKLKVVLVIFVNGTLGLVRQMQKHDFGKAFATEIKSPDFKLLSAAYGVDGHTVKSARQLKDALKKALGANRPAVIEVLVDKEIDA